MLEVAKVNDAIDFIRASNLWTDGKYARIREILERVLTDRLEDGEIARWVTNVIACIGPVAKDGTEDGGKEVGSDEEGIGEVVIKTIDKVQVEI